MPMRLIPFRVASLLALFSVSAFGRVSPPSPVPEPGALILLATGIGAVILLARKRMNK